MIIAATSSDSPGHPETGRRPLGPLRRRRTGVPLFVVALLVVACGSTGTSTGRTGSQATSSTVTVMTRNLDEGTDFGFVVGASAKPFSIGAPATWAEVLQSGVPQRAALVADEIAVARPDLVSLQEVAKWTGPGSNGTVTLDAQAALLSELAAKGAHYQVVETVPEEQISAAIGSLSVTFLDRDVLLTRSDEGGRLRLSNARQGHYSSLLGFSLPVIGQVTVTRGWAYVDATVQGRTVRFIATHLESYDPRYRLLQAGQLTAPGGPAATPLPVVLAGDLNTGPNDLAGTAGQDTVAAYNGLTGARFRDVWAVLHPGVPGYTDSFHTEDPFVDNTTPTERIDLVLIKGGVVPAAVSLVGTQKVNGVWPSDHAGPVARLTISG